MARSGGEWRPRATLGATHVHKLDPRAKPAILAGYAERADFSYRIYDPFEENIVTREVIIDESRTIDFLMITKRPRRAYKEYLIDVNVHTQALPNIRSAFHSSRIDIDQDETASYPESEECYQSLGCDDKPVVNSAPLYISSTSKASDQKECSIMSSEKANGSSSSTIIPGGEPSNYKEAMASPDSEEWSQAMANEYNSLIENETWKLEELPSNAKVISSRWVFKRKQDINGKLIYKARLVARGFEQRYGYDYVETFSPTVLHDSILILLSLAASRDYELVHIDVHTAFLSY